LGLILFEQGQLEDSLSAFRKAAQTNYNYPNAYYGAGLVFVQLKQYEQAIKVIKYARDIYQKQGNMAWANNAEKLLTQIRNLRK
jgi:tetratricopeptide (TPR) repeat protein